VASILLVCSGNLCRSPFAEGVLRRLLTERFGPSAPEVSSVGTIARDGEPTTAEAIAVASEHGIDASSHAARRLTREDLAEADLVLAVSAEHRDEIARLDPQAITKTFTVKELVRLLEDLPSPERGEGQEWLAARIAEADSHRRTGFSGNPHDEDVADPLGQPLETYRAVAWELAAWSERLVRGLFGVTAGTIPRPGAE
jgi:protein-tyrosine phosphatase